MSNKDGGPAFPRAAFGEGFRENVKGMSIRDYLTCEYTKAWIQVFGERRNEPGYSDDSANAYAFKHGRDQADAHLGWIAEREKNG